MPPLSFPHLSLAFPGYRWQLERCRRSEHWQFASPRFGTMKHYSQIHLPCSTLGPRAALSPPSRKPRVKPCYVEWLQVQCLFKIQTLLLSSVLPRPLLQMPTCNKTLGCEHDLAFCSATLMDKIKTLPFQYQYGLEWIRIIKLKGLATVFKLNKSYYMWCNVFYSINHSLIHSLTPTAVVFSHSFLVLKTWRRQHDEFSMFHYWLRQERDLSLWKMQQPMDRIYRRPGLVVTQIISQQL